MFLFPSMVIPVGPLRPLVNVLATPAEDIFEMVPLPKFVTYKFPPPSIVKYCGLSKPVANVVKLNVVSYVNIGPWAVLPFVDTMILPVPQRDGTVTCNCV